MPRSETPRSRSAHECRRVPRPLSAASRLIARSASAPEGVASRGACHVHVRGGAERARGATGERCRPRHSRGLRGAKDRARSRAGINREYEAGINGGDAEPVRDSSDAVCFPRRFGEAIIRAMRRDREG